MCRFEYKKFDACGDYTIEVCDYCEKALWKAGLTGRLQLCVPALLERSLEWSGSDDHEPPKAVIFIGYEGFCHKCEEEYMVPHTIPQRNYSDHELDYWKPYNEFDPHSPAPYLLIHGLSTTIPSLLGIEDQFQPAVLEEIPCIWFPERVEKRSWSELRQIIPFVTQGVLLENFSLTFDEALARLGLTKGITSPDRDQISDALQSGSDLKALYNQSFKSRGMPLAAFNSLVGCIRTADVEVEPKQQEARREFPHHFLDFSDVSTLSSLSDTPELPGLPELSELPESGAVVSPTPSPPQPRSLMKTLNTGESQLQNKPGEQNIYASARRRNHAKATRLARTAIAGQSSQAEENLITASNPRDRTLRASAPIVETEGLDESMSPGEEPRYNLRKHRSVGAQPQRPSFAKRLKLDEAAYKTSQGRRHAIVPSLQEDDTLDTKNSTPSTVETIMAAPTAEPRASKQAKKSVVPTHANEADQEDDIEQLYQHTSASMGSGGGSMVSPGPRPQWSDMARRNATGAAAARGNQAAGYATLSESTGTSMATGSWTMGQSMAGHPAFGTQPVPGDGSPLQPRGSMRRASGAVGADGSQWFQSRHYAQPLQETRRNPHDPMRLDRQRERLAMQQQRSKEVIENRLMRSYRTQQPRGIQRSQPHGIQQPRGSQQSQSYGSQQFHGIQQSYGAQQSQTYGTQQFYGTQQSYGGQSLQGIQQAFGAFQPYGMQHQPYTAHMPHHFEWRAAQNIGNTSQANQQALTREALPSPASSNAQHSFFQTSTQSMQPAFPRLGGPRQLFHVPPQHPQTPTRSRQPTRPRAAGTQQMAQGLTRLPQGSSQSSRGAQHPRVRGLREVPPPPARLQKAIDLSGSSGDEDDDEDEDLQDSSPEAWQKSRASRKQGARRPY